MLRLTTTLPLSFGTLSLLVGDNFVPKSEIDASTRWYMSQWEAVGVLVVKEEDAQIAVVPVRRKGKRR